MPHESFIEYESCDAKKDQDLQVQPFVAALKDQEPWGHFRCVTQTLML